MKLKTLIIAAAALNAGILGASVASAKGHGERPAFSELDANSDGQVTLEEMQAHKAARFTDADTNGDGALSAEELTAKATERGAKRVAKMLERHDANGDGLLQQSELPQPSEDRMAKMFDRLDADNSGGLSEEELANAKKGKGKGKGEKRNDG